MSDWYREERRKYLRLAVGKRSLAEALSWPYLENLSWFQAWPGGWTLHGRGSRPSVGSTGQRSMNFELPGVSDPAAALSLATEKVRSNPERLKEQVRWYCPSHGWEEIVPRGEMHSGCPECGGYYCEPYPPSGSEKE